MTFGPCGGGSGGIGGLEGRSPSAQHLSDKMKGCDIQLFWYWHIYLSNSRVPCRPAAPATQEKRAAPRAAAAWPTCAAPAPSMMCGAPPSAATAPTSPPPRRLVPRDAKNVPPAPRLTTTTRLASCAPRAHTAPTLDLPAASARRAHTGRITEATAPSESFGRGSRPASCNPLVGRTGNVSGWDLKRPSAEHRP